MNEILLEYYQGKTKEFLKCEGYIREIIALIKKDRAAGYFSDRHVYRSAPPCAALEKELAKIFKVKEIKIYWDSAMINAYTLPPFSFAIKDYNANYKAGKYSDFKMHISVYENVVFDADLNEQEVLALILHEIGHNFYYCPITVAYDLVMMVVTLPIGLLMNLVVRGLYTVFAAGTDWVKKYAPFLFNMSELYFDVVNQIDSLGVLFAPIRVAQKLSNVAIRVITNNPISVSSITGYGGEKGADSMAAKYGYGPELATALKKMRSPKNYVGYQILSKTGAYGSIMDDITTLSTDIMVGMTLDPHPSNNQRAASVLKKLKKDLASGQYPPGAKKDLEKEIARMEKAFEAVNDPAVQSDVKIKKAWYNVLNAATDNHTDIRELFNFYFDSMSF